MGRLGRLLALSSDHFDLMVFTHLGGKRFPSDGLRPNLCWYESIGSSPQALDLHRYHEKAAVQAEVV